MEILLIGTAILLVLLKDKKDSNFIWPIKGPIKITSNYGEPRGDSFHTGLDVSAPTGTPVYAMADGRIVSYWNDTTQGGGLSLKIAHEGDYTVGFAHLSKNNLHLGGTMVKKGQVIAYTGNTGRSTGPHLHITIYKFGNRINPLSVLPKF